MSSAQTTVTTPELVLMNGGSFAAALALAAQQNGRIERVENEQNTSATVRPANRKAA